MRGIQKIEDLEMHTEKRRLRDSDTKMQTQILRRIHKIADSEKHTHKCKFRYEKTQRQIHKNAKLKTHT